MSSFDVTILFYFIVNRSGQWTKRESVISCWTNNINEKNRMCWLIYFYYDFLYFRGGFHANQKIDLISRPEDRTQITIKIA
jgi:hypothetical protein